MAHSVLIRGNITMWSWIQRLWAFVTRSGRSTQEQAQRLLGAIEASSTLPCAEAQDQIPDLVAFEAAGGDADGEPRFSELLRHFDVCENCLAAYIELSGG